MIIICCQILWNFAIYVLSGEIIDLYVIMLDIYMHVCWTTTFDAHCHFTPSRCNVKMWIWKDFLARLRYSLLDTVFLCREKANNCSEDCGYSRILHSPENGMNRCDCIVCKWSSKGQGYFMSQSLPTFGLLPLKPRQTEGWKANARG